MPTEGEGSHGTGIDALLPAEIAKKAEQIGVQKIRVDATTLLTLAVLAGAFIALGAMFATTVLAGANGTVPYGISRLLAGIGILSRPHTRHCRRSRALHRQHLDGHGVGRR